MRTAAAAAFALILSASSAFSENRIREFFEWGEYDSLFVALGDYFSTQHDSAGSDSACLYLSYLGVAYFAKGDIAEAQAQFRRALACKETLTLDKKYVTPEMTNLFASVKNDIEQQLAFSTQEESIQEAKELQHYEMESNGRQAAQLRSSFWRHAVFAASLGGVSVALGSLAGYEYSHHNASAGLRYALPSALCGSLCIVFTIQSISMQRSRKQLTDKEETHTAGATREQ